MDTMIIKNIWYMVLVLFVFSCDSFVEIDPPRTDLVRSTIFTNDATAEAAVADLYYTLRVGGIFASGNAYSVTYLTSLSSDEIKSYSYQDIDLYSQFNNNDLRTDNYVILSLWTDIYSTIYKANSIIEGVIGSNSLSLRAKSQFEGEAKFIRALCYFYLVNLWGDVPLVLTTDYRINSSISRTSKDQVYQQIITDLLDSQVKLGNDYSVSNDERVRANSWAATALLARTYLYTNDWHNAESQATALINSSIFELEPNLTDVFNKNNSEAILQLWTDFIPGEFGAFFVGPDEGASNGALSDAFFLGFEFGDQRQKEWIQLVYFLGVTYYRAYKYQARYPSDEYSVVLRLAEQYLIRAEARVRLGDLTGALSDVNVIRNRAGLEGVDTASEQEVLEVISAERRSEFFTEWGHRWFDLKRSGRINDVLGQIKSNWNSDDVLYPIPESQILNDPKQQNPGY